MPNFGVWEWLVILIIVLVIFGASRLKDIGQGLGGAINAFRREVKDGREEEAAAKEPATEESEADWRARVRSLFPGSAAAFAGPRNLRSEAFHAHPQLAQSGDREHVIAKDAPGPFRGEGVEA